MMKSVKCFIAAMAVIILSTGFVPVSVASNETTETDTEESVSCIMVSRISRAEVIDNQTILFHIQGNQTYENRLPFPCQGLKVEAGISYKTSINRLCTGEIVTVTRRLGTTCTLGSFKLYQEELEKETDTPKEQ